MPDDKPMASLESIAAQLTTVVTKVDTLATRVDALDARFDKVDGRLDKVDGRLDKMDARFDKMDARFDKMDARFDALDAKIDRSEAETRAQLSVKIEAVEERVTRVYDAVMALQDHHEANVKDHAAFDSRLENHDLRILALEHPNAPKG